MPSAESRVENTVENVGVVVFPMMTVDKNQKKKNERVSFFFSSDSRVES